MTINFTFLVNFIYFAIYFVSGQLILVKRAHTTTEREASGMVYSVQQFCHLLIGWKFTFHVGHDAPKYLLSKPRMSADFEKPSDDVKSRPIAEKTRLL